MRTLVQNASALDAFTKGIKYTHTHMDTQGKYSLFAYGFIKTVYKNATQAKNKINRIVNTYSQTHTLTHNYCHLNTHTYVYLRFVPFFKM